MRGVRSKNNDQRDPVERRRALLSRRTFLGLGAGAGAAVFTACQPGSFVLLPTPTDGKDLTVGLLVPRYSVDPNLAVELQAGLDQGLAAAGIDAAITAVGIDTGRVAAEEAFDARVQAGAKVVVGVVSSLVAPHLAERAAAARVPLIVTSAGANALDPAASSPYVAHNSLNLWQANAALGTWAARELGSRVWVASSAFDAGFDSLFAFEAAFVAAGGAVTGRSLTHLPGESTSGLERLGSEAAGSGAGFVFGQFSGPRASEFVPAAKATGLPVVTSCFAAAQAASSLGSAADGVVTSVSWPVGSVSPFTAIGEDTGTLIAGTSDLRSGLPVFAFTGARGACTVDTATNSVLAPLHRATVSGGAVTPADSLGSSADPGRVAPGPSGFVEDYLCG